MEIQNRGINIYVQLIRFPVHQKLHSTAKQLYSNNNLSQKKSKTKHSILHFQE